jgi:hypothetical protein
MINGGKDIYLNPIKALVIILNFLNLPTILKDVTTNNEFAFLSKLIIES